MNVTWRAYFFSPYRAKSVVKQQVTASERARGNGQRHGAGRILRRGTDRKASKDIFLILNPGALSKAPTCGLASIFRKTLSRV